MKYTIFTKLFIKPMYLKSPKKKKQNERNLYNTMIRTIINAMHSYLSFTKLHLHTTKINMQSYMLNKHV